MLAHALHLKLTSEYGFLKGSFIESAFFGKNSDRNWNPLGHDFVKEKMLVFKAAVAFGLSQHEAVIADPFVAGMSWGKGMWPSWFISISDLFTAWLSNMLIKF